MDGCDADVLPHTSVILSLSEPCDATLLKLILTAASVSTI